MRSSRDTKLVRLARWAKRVFLCGTLEHDWSFLWSEVPPRPYAICRRCKGHSDRIKVGPMERQYMEACFDAVSACKRIERLTADRKS